MPIFSVQQKHPRPSPSGDVIPPDVTTPPGARSARERLHDILFGVGSTTELPSEADLNEGQANALLANPDPLAKFRSIYCVLPPGGLFDTVTDIRSWNSSHKWCQQVPETQLRVVTPPPVGPGPSTLVAGRARLQSQLGLPSLPSVIDLTDETANAILALPAAQMVDAFRSRFCNPPVFYSNMARVSWINEHPWCPSPPPVDYTPWYIAIGLTAVAGGAWYWMRSAKKSKKLKAQS